MLLVFGRLFGGDASEISGKHGGWLGMSPSGADRCRTGCCASEISRHPSSSSAFVVGIRSVPFDHVPIPTSSWARRCSCKVALLVHSRCAYWSYPCFLCRKREMGSSRYDTSEMDIPITSVKQRPKTLRDA